ncbi:MAG: hypothetical protein ACLR2E_05890 [Lachnospiraceae bacterium]
MKRVSAITDDFDANGKHYSFSADGKCTITDANSGSNDADDSSNTNKDGSPMSFCSLRSMSPAEAMISIRAIIRPAEIMETPAENISLITAILCFPL